MRGIRDGDAGLLPGGSMVSVRHMAIAALWQFAALPTGALRHQNQWGRLMPPLWRANPVRTNCSVSIQSSEKLTLGLEERLGRENCRLPLATLLPNLARASRLGCAGEIPYGFIAATPDKAAGAWCSAIGAKAADTRKPDRPDVVSGASPFAGLVDSAKLVERD